MGTVTVTGTFQLPDGTPDSGSVRLSIASPAVLRDADPALITAAEVRADLDEHGQVSFDVVPSDDAGWAAEDPVPYRVSIRVGGMRSDYAALITSDCDIADLIALDGPPEVVAVPGPPTVLTVDATTTGAPGTDAEVGIDGTPPRQSLSFVVPRGDTGGKGDIGLTGPAPVLASGVFTATKVAVGGDPTASFMFTETAPGAYEVTGDVGVVTGDTGDTGPQGARGPEGPQGLTGPQGIQGIQGVQGPVGLTGPQGPPGALGAYQAKTADYTILGTDGTVAVDTTSGAVALTLPSAAANPGKWLRIVKTAGANTLTIQRAGSDTILPSSGTRTSAAFPADALMGEMVLVSSGSAWRVVSGQASTETGGRRLWRLSQSLMATTTTPGLGWVQVADSSTVGNLLTPNQASGTETLGDATGFSTLRCTLASDSGHSPYSGTRHLQALSTAADGAVRVYVGPGGVAGTPVPPGEVVTFSVAVKTAGAPPPMFLGTSWTDANGSDLGLYPYAARAASQTYSVAQWTLAVPITAVNTRFYVEFSAAGAGEYYYLDSFSVHRGAGGRWAMPGVPIVHTGIRPNPANASQVQVWNDATATWITV